MPRSQFYALSLFRFAIAVLICMSKQIKERKGRNTDQIFAVFVLWTPKSSAVLVTTIEQQPLRSTLRLRNHPLKPHYGSCKVRANRHRQYLKDYH